MIQLKRIILFLSALLVTSTVLIDQASVSAFAIAPSKTSLVLKPPSTFALQSNNKMPKNNQSNDPLRIRGGGTTSTTTTTATSTNLKSSATGAAPAPPKKLRLTALDGIRFLLCMHIVMGHFLRFANPSESVLRFFAHINVTVGAFFALSGYVTAYTTTEVAERKASPRLTNTPSQKWFLGKAMSYYPMHWFVLLLFSPMFVYVDMNAGGPVSAIVHGLLSATLTQAWFPMHAEVWNAPTWFLSSLTFATALMPFCLPKIAEMDKKGLRRTSFWLYLVNLLPVLGYAHDNNVWGLFEGMTAPKNHPAMQIFNTHRFHPVFNVAEVMLGVTACRLAMLDSEKEGKPPVKTNWLSTAVPFASLVGFMIGRATGVIPDVSDLLVRSVFFTPLFLRFVMASHRNAVQGASDPLSSFLSNKALVWFGGLSFPIYIVHGPLGQVFYKRLIAGKLWGGVLKGPGYFALYMATVFASAWLLQTFFLQNNAVKSWSKNKVEQLSSWF